MNSSEVASAPEGDGGQVGVAGAAIVLDGIGLTYPGPPEVEALRGVNLTVRDGQMVTVAGPSGSGKSTLLNVIGLLDRPSVGRYWLGGVETSQMSEKDRSATRAAWLGLVFQSFHLLAHRSAIENVALGLLYSGVSESERLSRARLMLERVGLADRVDAVPSRLSGGQRQRVAIARALVHRPRVLLCDEPTGNLDRVTASTVMDLIEQVNREGQTVLVITHDPNVARRGGRHVVIEDGQLAEVSLP